MGAGLGAFIENPGRSHRNASPTAGPSKVCGRDFPSSGTDRGESSFDGAASLDDDDASGATTAASNPSIGGRNCETTLLRTSAEGGVDPESSLAEALPAG